MGLTKKLNAVYTKVETSKQERALIFLQPNFESELLVILLEILATES